MNQLLSIAHDRNAAALRRASTLEKLARARGNYERETSDANYTALFEAENAWLRLQLEDAEADKAALTLERDRWKGIVRRIWLRVQQVKRDAEAAAGPSGVAKAMPDKSPARGRELA